jgi:hypothetical protein
VLWPASFCTTHLSRRCPPCRPHNPSPSASDQLEFNRWLAAESHARGMAAGLKNDVLQIPELAPEFDFFVNE